LTPVRSLWRPSSARDDPVVTRRLRVLWLIKGLGAGGAERLLALAARVRDRAEFDYSAAYLLPWKTELLPELTNSGMDVHCLGGGREWDLRWGLRLRRLLETHPQDIVHVHSPYVAGVARLVVRSLPAGSRPRLVATEHLPWSGYVWPTRLLNAITLPFDDADLAVSRAVANSIPRWLAKRVRVVLQGIDVREVREVLRCRNEVRAEMGIGADEVLVGTVGNLRPQKGYPILMEAAHRVVGQGLPVRFAAVGYGPLEGEIRGLRRSLGLEDRFHLLGYREDSARILAGCDLFVLASLYEGLPLAMMEALALGLPVVATAVGGIPEGVSDGVEGLLVPPGRPDLLAEALAALVRDQPLRERMSQAAWQRADYFDIGRAVRGTEAIYRRLAGRASPNGEVI
jgi:glycosyltransferase involved in cell wall biosynthesis